MFERRNQNILSEHYARLVERDIDSDDDDFITLKRTDHDLAEESLDVVKVENLSHRKQKLGLAKRKMILNAPSTNRLVFDDAGQAHVASNVIPADDWVRAKGGINGVKHESAKFVEEEKGKMQLADIVDKQQAKDKKREKKRKRKEREKLRKVCVMVEFPMTLTGILGDRSSFTSGGTYDGGRRLYFTRI